MSETFYENARLYDLMFGTAAPKVDFYLAQARRAGGRILELACGTGTILLPIASAGIPAVGLDVSVPMLSEAQRKAKDLGLDIEFVHGDMRSFELDGRFDLIFVASNSLLHLYESAEIVTCFQTVARHLSPAGRFVFDVFNPSVQLLADADGARRHCESFQDPERGEVRVDVARTYDASAQVTREVWYFSASSEPDFLVAPLEIRSIFPQELPLLVSAGGLRLLDRHGDFAGNAFAADSPQQVCVCALDEETRQPWP